MVAEISSGVERFGPLHIQCGSLGETGYVKGDVFFVIMPFGTKQHADGSSKYDFDKVYRVLIQRAIRESGMTSVRADERVTSAPIHTEMFRDLRDRAVVLADLSLDNPNVFYELGIRHVMSAK